MAASCLSSLEFDFVSHRPGLIDALTEHASEYSGVIFTSARSVMAIRSLVHEEHVPYDNVIQTWGCKAIYCVGEATSRAAAECLKSTPAIGDAGSAFALGLAIAERHAGGKLLFLCGNQRRDELPSVLKSKQVRIGRDAHGDAIGMLIRCRCRLMRLSHTHRGRVRALLEQ